jgi:tRNA pseudouridine32 synthase/23S rRNA pseudouridine746 synthase
MVPNNPGFRMKIVDGHANSVTDIVLKDRRGDLGYFELLPQTGKKHQLRVHMLSIGYPILNDLFYPELRMRSPIDFSNPLQLLASHLTFTDPVSGLEFAFESKRKLECR